MATVLPAVGQFPQRDRPRESVQELDLKLRVVWGGGQARRWAGTISIDEGSIANVRTLGLSPDAPGSRQIDPRFIRFSSRSVTAFDGVEFRIVGRPDAQVQLHLVAGLGPGQGYLRNITLSELIDGRMLEPIDAEDNWIRVERAPGDRLRVHFTRDHLVFSPGDRFPVDIDLANAGLAARTSFTLQLAVTGRQGAEQTWSTEFDVRTNERGEVEPLEGSATAGPAALSFDPTGNPTTIRNVSIPIPLEEGVYQLECQLTPRNLTSPLIRSRPLLTRAIEFVVVDDQRPRTEDAPWTEVLAFDPANPDWWERLRRIPQLRVISLGGQTPVGNQRDSVVESESRVWTQLEPGGWVAYPLPLERQGVPHYLEVEYAAAMAQKLGISIVEPDSAGRVESIGIDSGVSVDPGPLTAEDRPADMADWHRMMIWPRTSVPYLVIHNLDSTQPARFGSIRVSSGPDRIPAGGYSNTEDLPTVEQGRLFGEFLATPLFPESFSAAEHYDPGAERTLDDWNSFWTGGQRFVDHMHLSGRRAAMVNVLGEGSTIYPSRLLDPTPKYDTGAYFGNGRDPIRKDVLEMMFRLFDREGFTLIPCLEFSGPLVEIEDRLRELRQNGESGRDLEMISDKQALGHYQSPRRGPAYNPLSPSVQRAMLSVVDEVLRRYGHHESFGGIAIRIGPNTYTHFPSDRWGYDFETVQRYLLETGQLEADDDRDTQVRAYTQLVTAQPAPADWFRWRATQLTRFYGDISRLTRGIKPSAQTYLALGELLNEQTAVRELHPTIARRDPPAHGVSRLESVMLGMGLSPPALQEHDGLVVLQSIMHSPLRTLPEQRVQMHIDSSGQAGELYSRVDGAGALIWQPSEPRRLDDFDTAGPFIPERTDLVLFPQLASDPTSSRRRFVHQLAQRDVRSIFSGGMLCVHGEQAALREIIDVFGRLPDQPFDDVAIKMPKEAISPVKLRHTTFHGKTYFYAVNDCPWQVNLSLSIGSHHAMNVQSLSLRTIAVIRQNDHWSQVRVTMQPYDLVGWVVDQPDVASEEVGVFYVDPAGIGAKLRRDLDRLHQFNGRISAQPQSLDVLSNPSFEEASIAGVFPGWEAARGQGIEISDESSASRTGQQSLRIASDGQNVAWLRSAPFDPPSSGRISISIWLRTPDPRSQPPLRLSIEGSHYGEEYYRFAKVGALAAGIDDAQLTAEWKRFAVHFDDLPPHGLSNLRIGVDLMGRGEVLIDDVDTYDLWLDENDFITMAADQLTHQKNLARQDYIACLRYLESYWPRLIPNPPPRRERLRLDVEQSPIESEKENISTSVLNRLMSIAPPRLFRFR